MPLPLQEKLGAIWLEEHADYLGKAVFERHEPSADRLGVVFKRKEGLFKAVIFHKSQSPQWRLPFWSESYQDAIIDNERDAVRHVLTLLGFDSDIAQPGMGRRFGFQSRVAAGRLGAAGGWRLAAWLALEWLPSPRAELDRLDLLTAGPPQNQFSVRLADA
jgi:hypothetical protein